MGQSKLYGKVKGICIWNSLAQTVVVPFTLLMAWLMSKITEKAAAGDVILVARMSIFLLILFLLYGIFQTGTDILARRQQVKIMNHLRIAFLELVLCNPLHRLRTVDYGELNENLNDDLNAWAKRYMEGIPAMVSSGVGAAGYLGYMLYRSPAVAGTIFIISLVQLIPPLLVKRYMQVNYDRCRELEARITDHMAEAVSGFETIKLYGLKQWWMTKMSCLQREYLRVGNRSEAAASTQRVLYRLLDHILKYGTYAIMGMYALTGYCDFNIAVEGIVLSESMFAAVRRIFDEIPRSAVAKQAEKRLCRWKVQKEKEERGGGYQTTGYDRIKMEDICYAPEERKIFDNLTYYFQYENRYLLTGSNGAGKTTLLNLISGLYRPDSGRILPEGEGLVSYVLQDDPVYDFDVHTLFSMLDAGTRAAARSVASRLGLPEEAMDNVPIASLSGGERKKVFLALGFAAGSRWLLLDEPSNNLDRHGKEALCGLMKERKGILAVSHDPVLVKSADLILRIEKGGVAEL
ncbi:MAG: ABC transporter ATP-binding protein [Ruminococcus sp.]|nr:ABC transporter ATP-binding protein [Ruminococcus sp.]